MFYNYNCNLYTNLRQLAWLTGSTDVTRIYGITILTWIFLFYNWNLYTNLTI